MRERTSLTGRVASDTAADVGALIGMTVPLSQLDLEEAIELLGASGFNAVEVFLGQVGPRIVDVPIGPTHLDAVARLLESHELRASSLNTIVNNLVPSASGAARDRAVAQVRDGLTLGAALGAPRILIWDGEIDDAAQARDAPEALAECIHRATELAQATVDERPLPRVSVELHPNTFTLKHGLLSESAQQLVSVGAGICLDLAHFGVALGPDFARLLSDDLLAAVNHVHFADSDCVTEQLHLPPGIGRIDLASVTGALAGSGLSAAWDLFGWPAPRTAVRRHFSSYASFVSVVSASEDRTPSIFQR